VNAVIVPAGVAVKLRPGQAGYITQALGGSFTVYVDAICCASPARMPNAIGQDVVKPPELPPNATEEDVRKLGLGSNAHLLRIRKFPINIVDLGLVYECDSPAERETAPGSSM